MEDRWKNYENNHPILHVTVTPSVTLGLVSEFLWSFTILLLIVMGWNYEAVEIKRACKNTGLERM